MMDSATPMPSNVHISQHPCVRAKLSRLRSKDTDARETKALVHEIATMLGCDALGRNLEVVESGMVSLFVQTGPDRASMSEGMGLGKDAEDFFLKAG